MMPEEVTALTEGDAEVLLTFDEPAARHVQVTDMALERAKRMAESGNDIVLFVDRCRDWPGRLTQQTRRAAK